MKSVGAENKIQELLKKTKNSWQSPACSPRGIAVTPVADNETKRSSDRPRKHGTNPLSDYTVLFCSLAVLDPRVNHTMNLFFPFISVLCHSNWPFHRESCPRIDVVHPGRAWSSWLPRRRAPGIVPCIISFSRQLLCFLLVWPYYANFLALAMSDSFLFALALLRTHLFVSFAVRKTRIIFSSAFTSKASRCVSSLILSFQLAALR